MSDRKVGIFKTIAGQELMAEIVEENDDGWIVNRPVTASVTGMNDRGAEIQLLPLYIIVGSDVNDVPLFRSTIMSVITGSQISKEVEDHYFTQVSGIKLV